MFRELIRSIIYLFSVSSSIKLFPSFLVILITPLVESFALFSLYLGATKLASDDSLSTNLLLFILLWIFSIVLAVISPWAFYTNGASSSISLSKQYLMRYFSLPYPSRNSYPLSDSLNYFQNTLKNISDFYIPQTLVFLQSTFVLVALVITLLFLLPHDLLSVLSLLSIPCIITYFVLAKMSRSPGSLYTKSLDTTILLVQKYFQQPVLATRDDVRNLGLSQILKSFSLSRSLFVYLCVIGASTKPLVEFIILAFIALSSIWIKIDIKQLFVLIASLGFAYTRLMPNIAKLMSASTVINAFHKTALNSLDELSNLDSLAKYTPEKLSISNISLELNPVNLDHSDSSDALLTIQSPSSCVPLFAGSSYCLIGESGVGKSTLMMHLLGIYPYYKDLPCLIQNLDSFYISSRSTLYFDDIRYFGATIGESFQPLHDHFTFSERTIFFFQLCLFDYKNLASFRYSDLSNGQKARFHLAHCLSFNPAIIVVDELFTAISLEMEFTIIQNIYAEFPSILFISISHRLSSCELYDYTLNLSPLWR